MPVETAVWAAEAAPLYAELLGLAAPRRFEAIREARFKNLFLAELLLREGERLAPAEPEKSEELALLAYHLGGSTYPRELSVWVEEVVARSCCLLGNARRVGGDLEGADKRFRMASAALAVPPDSPVRAFFCQMLAYLREDQSRDREAEPLLWRAARIYREAGRRAPQGECNCRLGFLFLRAYDLERAASVLLRAWLLLQDAGSPLLAARSGLGLAVCLAALGQPRAARVLLEQCRELTTVWQGDSAELVRLHWLEGRIEAHLGDLAEAVPRLEAVRRRLLDEEKLVESALCTIDLATVYAKVGRAEDILPLIHEIAAHFPGSLGLTRILVALCGVLNTAHLGEGDLETVARRAVGLILRPEEWHEPPPPEEN